MTHRLHRSLIALGILGLLAGASRPAVADAPDVFDAERQAPAFLASTALRARVVDVDRAVLRESSVGDALRLELFDDLTVLGSVERRVDHAPHRYTIHARLDGLGEAWMTLTVNGMAVAGTGRTGGHVIRVRSNGNGLHVVEELDPAQAIPCQVGAEQPIRFELGDPVAGGELCDDGSIVDVLVLYTPDARNAAGGVAGIEAEIEGAIVNNNIAYVESGQSTQMNLVFIAELDILENDLSLGRLTDREDGWYDWVHDLRDAYGADQVAVIYDGGGGVANGLWSLDPGSEATSFNLTGLESIPFHTLSHEMGHNMGCCHAIGDGGGCPTGGGLLFDYSSGHRFFGSSGDEWRTTMAYSPGTRILRFSNPEVLFDDVPTGVNIGQPGQAHNAQTISLSALTVSNWRCNDGVCESLDLPSQYEDCNENGVPDACDIALGTSTDNGGNGVPDECDECLGDLVPDGQVDIDDVLVVVGNWGLCGVGISCPGDTNLDLVVDVNDLLQVFADWGPCQ